MLDFTSALYLGLRHGSDCLRPWAQLTTGAPAALAEPPEAGRLAADLAALTGVERAVLARSTLHAFWDLFGARDDPPGEILVDAGAYPVARWGAERAAARGVPLRAFAHHDPAALRCLLGLRRSPPRRPWIVTDGFCPGCGRLAPLVDLLALARDHGGRLLVDDTQALGVLGHAPGPAGPYGRGGGGSLPATGAAGAEVVLVASLAKAFGAPLAMVGGPRDFMARHEAGSETRVHASPPSLADLRAAERALRVNRTRGESLRFRLAGLVARLRRGLEQLGARPGPSPFPVQRLASGAGAAPVFRHLAVAGVRCVLLHPACAVGPHLAAIVTARHGPGEIDALLAALAGAFSATRDATARRGAS